MCKVKQNIEYNIFDWFRLSGKVSTSGETWFNQLCCLNIVLVTKLSNLHNLPKSF